MTYQLVHKGAVREFDLHIPWAWEYWHERAFTEDSREGLPLVIALHGGGQDPGGFATDWNFPLLINNSDETNWQDRFFVLYPHGFDSSVLFTVLRRGWNMGFTGQYMAAQNDVSFIEAAMDSVDKMLGRKLKEIGVSRPAIDRDRRFVFGYSMGGMMAYKLAHDLPDTFGALWVAAGAYGGRSFEGFSPTVTNDPQGRHSVSLFAHHGEMDTVVPPGPRNDPSGRVQPETEIDFGPPFGTLDVFNETGITDPAVADSYNNSYRTLAAAVEEYRRYNDCEKGFVAAESGPNQPDVAGGTNSETYVFRQDGGAINPEVTVYRDGEMSHTGFTAAGQYKDTSDVWSFFKDHPRVRL